MKHGHIEKIEETFVKGYTALRGQPNNHEDNVTRAGAGNRPCYIIMPLTTASDIRSFDEAQDLFMTATTAEERQIALFHMIAQLRKELWDSQSATEEEAENN